MSMFHLTDPSSSDENEGYPLDHDTESAYQIHTTATLAFMLVCGALVLLGFLRHYGYLFPAGMIGIAAFFMHNACPTLRHAMTVTLPYVRRNYGNKEIIELFQKNTGTKRETVINAISGLAETLVRQQDRLASAQWMPRTITKATLAFLAIYEFALYQYGMSYAGNTGNGVLLVFVLCAVITLAILFAYLQASKRIDATAEKYAWARMTNDLYFGGNEDVVGPVIALRYGRDSELSGQLIVDLPGKVYALPGVVANDGEPTEKLRGYIARSLATYDGSPVVRGVTMGEGVIWQQ